VLGVHDDVRTRLGVGFPAEEARVVLLGTTSEEFGGSAWADVMHRHLGGRPPAVDLDAERNLAALIAAAAAEGLLTSAHDLSDGGLGVALAESCLRGGVGCWISLSGFDNRAGVAVDAPPDLFTALFSESSGRAVVSVTPGREDEFADLCDAHAVPATVIGRTGGETLTVVNAFEVAVTDLEQVWAATLPALFG
jgi:phosphoribosylformylglycinamidine synthase